MKSAFVSMGGVAAALLLSVSCSSDGAAGGPVSGTPDAHCGASEPLLVEASACTTPEDEGASGAGGAGGAVGESGAAGVASGEAGLHEEPEGEGGSSTSAVGDCNATHDADYGDTLYGNEGDDDDCKYHASWSSTPIRRGQNTTLTVAVTDKTSGAALHALSDGVLPLSRIELYQPCQPNRRPPAQDYRAEFRETEPGLFSAGPFVFDQAGRWVVRFHFFEQCLDSERSPHGHIAFFVDVP